MTGRKLQPKLSIDGMRPYLYRFRNFDYQFSNSGTTESQRRFFSLTPTLARLLPARAADAAGGALQRRRLLQACALGRQLLLLLAAVAQLPLQLQQLALPGMGHRAGSAEPATGWVLPIPPEWVLPSPPESGFFAGGFAHVELSGLQLGLHQLVQVRLRSVGRSDQIRSDQLVKVRLPANPAARPHQRYTGSINRAADRYKTGTKPVHNQCKTGAMQGKKSVRIRCKTGTKSDGGMERFEGLSRD